MDPTAKAHERGFSWSEFVSGVQPEVTVDAAAARPVMPDKLLVTHAGKEQEIFDRGANTVVAIVERAASEFNSETPLSSDKQPGERLAAWATALRSALTEISSIGERLSVAQREMMEDSTLRTQLSQAFSADLFSWQGKLGENIMEMSAAQERCLILLRRDIERTLSAVTETLPHAQRGIGVREAIDLRRDSSDLVSSVQIHKLEYDSSQRARQCHMRLAAMHSK